MEDCCPEVKALGIQPVAERTWAVRGDGTVTLPRRDRECVSILK